MATLAAPQASGSTLSPVAQPFMPQGAAAAIDSLSLGQGHATPQKPSPAHQPQARVQLQKKRGGAPSAWRAQAESLAQRPIQQSKPASNPVRVTDEDGTAVTLTPSASAAAPPVTPPVIPKASPATQASAATTDEEVLINDEDGGQTRLWADGKRLVLEVDKCEPGTGRRVDPALRIVHSVTLFPETNHIRFGCANSDWNVVVQGTVSRHEVYRRINTVAAMAGITVIVHEQGGPGHAMEVTTGPGPMTLGPSAGRAGYMPLPTPYPPYYGAPQGDLPHPHHFHPHPHFHHHHHHHHHHPPPHLLGGGKGGAKGKGGGGGLFPQANAFLGKQKVLIDEIQGLLQEQGEEDWPQGLRQMPLHRLREYRQFLVVKKGGKPPTEGKEAPEAPPAAPAVGGTKPVVGNVVRYVSGGRYNGNRKWWDGDELAVGAVGVVSDVDESNQWSFLVNFLNLWPTRLGEGDLQLLAPSVSEGEETLKYGADGNARSKEEAEAEPAHGDWEAGKAWKAPAERPPERLTGPDKQKLRRDDGGRGGGGRGGGQQRGGGRVRGRGGR
eukprot:Hpha_TRINITY_DN16237_c1_g3::TRINITY_DN16237_c1_g3_i1::g.16479::m.16479